MGDRARPPAPDWRTGASRAEPWSQAKMDAYLAFVLDGRTVEEHLAELGSWCDREGADE